MLTFYLGNGFPKLENNMKKQTMTLLSLFSIACLCSCNSEKPIIIEPDYYKDVESRAKFDNENPLNFDEKMKNGLSNDTWLTLDGAWHTNVEGAEHNGVRSRNLFYTKDNEGNDLLAIKGRGKYYNEDSQNKNLPEGGCIISKEHLTPGRYEIEMASFPRVGAVTAMWTYCTTTGNEATSQNEIDIELGGNAQYQEEWCTSWTKKNDKKTESVNVGQKLDQSLFFNDGKMHKFTFDWYTNYGEDGEARVDWFVDEKLIYSVDGSCVPTHAMPLWIGVWFPPLWAGVPLFNEDYLLIKNIKFTSFEDTQYFDSCRSEPGYTKKAINEANIQNIDYNKIKNINKLSNGDFESIEQPLLNDYNGWIIDNTSKGKVILNDQKTLGSHSFELQAGEDSEDYHGEYLRQSISAAYPGFKYNLSIDAKKLNEASNGNIEIYQRNIGKAKIKKDVIKIDSLDFKTYTKKIVMIEDAYELEIDITSEDGSILYDNASLIFEN